MVKFTLDLSLQALVLVGLLHSSVLVTACKDKYRIIDGHTGCLKDSPLMTPGSAGVTAAEKQLIVEEHNRYRGMVKPPAADMQKMVWDEELADLAQRWASNCVYEHEDSNGQRSIPGRFAVGQNLALDYPTWNKTIYEWYIEHREFSFGVGKKHHNAGPIGHYTQLAYATAARIGCGKATCENGTTLVNDFHGTGVIYVCDYAFGQTMKNVPYQNATNRCEDCPLKCVNGLCDCGGKVCENGGKLNLATCECNCAQSFYRLEECKLNCSSAKDNWACTTQYYTKEQCLTSANLPYICPNFCSLCPWSGFNYTEGSVPIPTTTTPTTTPTAAPSTTIPSNSTSNYTTAAATTTPVPASTTSDGSILPTVTTPTNPFDRSSGAVLTASPVTFALAIFASVLRLLLL